MPEITAFGPLDFSCAICGKSFERRDLRQRHRRRCEKSLRTSRAPKKKSCNSCARSKVKCDLQVPACQRCLDRQTNCEYPIDPSTAAMSQLSEGNPTSVSSTSDSSTISPTDLAPADLQSTSAALGTLLNFMDQSPEDDLMNVGWNTGLDYGSPMNFWNDSAWNYTPAEMEALSTDTAAEAPSMSGVELRGFLQNTDSSGRFPDFGFLNGIGAEHVLGNLSAVNSNEKSPSPISATRPGSERASQTLPNNNSGTRNWTSDNIDNGIFLSPQSHFPRQSDATGPSISDRPLGHQSNLSASSLSASLGIHSPPNNPRNTTLRASNGSSTANSLRGSSSSRPSMSSVTVQLSRLFGVDDITNILCDYPKHMLRPDFWSPFVHHRHYRCSQGGLAEPIAIALCCVSANLQSVESSLSFVCRMINDERERLVNDFPTKSDNLEDALAALHAMCIYQIETILAFRSQKLVKQRISSAELYHHFLLKMTRRLCQEHIERVSLRDNTIIAWQCWTMAETLRRTTFLVNMINELSYYTNALNGTYYEPLHESLMLDMPLPAPDSMWRALNEDEWATARDASSWTGTGVMTLRTSMERLEAESGSRDGSSSIEVKGLGNIQQISNLIISSARHLRQG